MDHIGLLKKIGLYKPLSVLKWSYKEIPYMLAACIFRRFPVDKKKILFSSYNGKQFNAQPKCISDWVSSNKYNMYEMVWVLPKNIPTPDNIRKVSPNSLKYLYELSTAGVWVDNCRKPYWIKKRSGQLYIQTWHGPVCLKAVEKDAQETLLPYYVISAIQDSRNADYIVAETKWRKENINRSFWYSGSIIEGQFCANQDINFRETENRVRRFYNIESDTHIVSYLPTFRKDGKTTYYLSDFNTLMRALKERYGGKWIVIVRLHPNIASQVDAINYNENILNGTLYPNANDLIAASEFLITDYSGCLFDGFMFEKKVILYAEDFEEYVENDRSLYFDLSRLPSPLAKNMDDLTEIITKFDDDVYDIERRKFVDTIGYYKNDASILCGEIIENFVQKGVKK